MVPKLRFSKFSQEWTKIRLGDYLQNYQQKVSSDTDIPVYSSSRQGLKPQSEYFADRELQNDGEYGVVPCGYITYRHMSDDNTFHFNINDKLPKIAVSKEYPVFTGKGLNNYFLLSKLNHTNEFKLFAIQQKAGGTRTRLYFKKLCEWCATFPELEEQIQIADFLSSVDEKITLLNKQYDLLCQYKKGMMQKIFSQEVRFKDENGEEFPEWELKQLSEIAIINPKNKVIPSEFIYIDLESVEKGMLLKEQLVNKEDAPSRAQRLLVPGDVLFQLVRPYQKNNYIFLLNGDYVASTGYAQLRAKYNSLFLYQLLHLESFTSEVMNRCTGTSYPAINSSDLASIEAEIPCEKEQTKIANFLSALDYKITTKKVELDKLKTWKQGLLQQMFV
ncbi:restriction endonuclease subunit S [Salmonella enterica]